MAGHSKKKSQIKQNSQKFLIKIAILVATVLHLIFKTYSVFFNGSEFTKGDIIGFLSLSLINFALYKLILVFSESFFYAYLNDLLIINLIVEVTVNFHWKCWFIYLVVPGYFLFIGLLKLYDYVKTIGKVDENEVLRPAPTIKKYKSN